MQRGPQGRKKSGVKIVIALVAPKNAQADTNAVVLLYSLPPGGGIPRSRSKILEDIASDPCFPRLSCSARVRTSCGHNVLTGVGHNFISLSIRGTGLSTENGYKAAQSMMRQPCPPPSALRAGMLQSADTLLTECAQGHVAAVASSRRLSAETT